jgi:hypothetical protein
MHSQGLDLASNAMVAKDRAQVVLTDTQVPFRLGLGPAVIFAIDRAQNQPGRAKGMLHRRVVLAPLSPWSGIRSMKRCSALIEATTSPALSSFARTFAAGMPSANARPSTSLRISTAGMPTETARLMNRSSGSCGVQVRFRAKWIGIRVSLARG